jgi:molybdopterin molybdotransferase
MVEKMRLYSVMTPREVQNTIKAHFTPLELELIELGASGGRVVGKNILAFEDVPGFDRSIVDGYAVRAADTFGAAETLPAMLDFSGEVKMGEKAPSLAGGSCFYVPTGGMLPQGADAVVMIEDTEMMGDLVNCFRQVAPGQNLIRRGEDLTQGDVVIEKGRRLRAAELGLLASLGITEVSVYRNPLVAIYSTGDEIVPVHTANLAPGQIRDSNALALAELVRRQGGKVVQGGILRDDYAEFRQGIEDLLPNVDFLVLSGGSSVGKRDFTAKVMQELGETGLLVEGIAIQPGKPTLLAKCKGKPVLGLPGHPVSALNIFSLFGSCIMEQLQGFSGENFPATVKAKLVRNIPSRQGRTDYVRVKLKRTGEELFAVPIFGRSGLLRTLADADGVVLIPPGNEGFLAGRDVEVILWD